MKLTKSQLRQIIKEELSQLLESDEMVYGGATEEPDYGRFMKDGDDTVRDYLAAMRGQEENYTQRMPDGSEKHMSEVLKLMWDFMRDNPGDMDGERTKAEAMKLGFGEFYAKELAKKYAGRVNSSSPTGDQMMNAVEAKGPGTPDARSGYRGSF
tara:strand:+ start:780 stop:1241 length:462 start_codon:yes stop_codon:yes gene_type:complete